MLPGWIRFYRFIFGAIGVAAIIHNRFTYADDPHFWETFTIQSNIVAAIVLLLGATVFAQRNPPIVWDVIRGSAVIMMLVTGIVFATLVGSFYNPLQTTELWSSSVMHQLIPVVMLVDLLIDPLHPRTPWWRVIFFLIFPLAYLGWALWNGNRTQWYPYEFITPSAYGNGMVGVLTLCAGLLGVFIVIGLLLIAYSRLRRAPRTVEIGW